MSKMSRSVAASGLGTWGPIDGLTARADSRSQPLSGNGYAVLEPPVRPRSSDG